MKWLWRATSCCCLVALFATQHYGAYKSVLPEFERRHGVKVGLSLVDQRALRTRLQNAMLAKGKFPIWSRSKTTRSASSRVARCVTSASST